MRRAASQDVQEHRGRHHQSGDGHRRGNRREAPGVSWRMDGRYVRHTLLHQRGQELSGRRNYVRRWRSYDLGKYLYEIR